MSIRTQQQGFVLVSVLLITSVSTLLAFSSIGESRLQERIAGNQIKEVNARSRAEQILFDAYSEVQAEASLSLSEINTLLNAKPNLQSAVGSGKIMLTSTGEYQGAVAYLKAVIEVASTPEESPPSGGLVACEGISIIGGGQVDSFDSTNGIYSNATKKSSGNVVTLNGDLLINGGTSSMGSAIVNGSVIQSGSTTIGGNVTANGNITLAQATVHGSLVSGGDMSLMGGTVGLVSDANSGKVNIGGSFVLNDSAKATGALNYNDSLLTKPYDSYDISIFSGDINSSAIESPVMPTDKCPVIMAMPTLSSDHVGLTMGNFHGQDTLTFNERTVVDTTGDSNNIVSSMTTTDLESEYWDGKKPVYVFDDLDLHNTEITIVGDVVIMVTNDLITRGGKTGFKFADNDTNSSLTILIEGQMDVSSSTKLFNNATIDKTNKKVPLTVYSSFESKGVNASEKAVTMAGAGAMYASLYAPLGDVTLVGGSVLNGAVLGKNIDVRGGAKLHYDEAIEKTKVSTAGSSSTKFASIYYHYPN